MDIEARRRFGPGGFPLPVLLGVLPLQSTRHAEFLHNEVPGITIPDETRTAMREAGEHGAEVGLELSLSLLAEVDHLVAGTYIMPSFGRYEQAAELVRRLRVRHAGIGALRDATHGQAQTIAPDRRGHRGDRLGDARGRRRPRGEPVAGCAPARAAIPGARRGSGGLRLRGCPSARDRHPGRTDHRRDRGPDRGRGRRVHAGDGPRWPDDRGSRGRRCRADGRMGHRPRRRQRRPRHPVRVRHQPRRLAGPALRGRRLRERLSHDR